jgi:flagellar hook-associated protein 1 FlgK
MTSTFLGIEIGKRAVTAHQQALNTTGHNLSTASTEGYSRQRVEFAPFEPLYLPALNREETAGQIGQGMMAERIERLRDQLLDRRIVAQAGGEGYWTARDPYVRMMEQAYLEIGSSSVRGQMDQFWDAWQELSVYPSDMAPRTAVIERGQTLIAGIHERFNALKGLQDMADQDIRLTVERANSLSAQIAGLNSDIQRIRAQGDSPNDLYDRRDLLVDKLSGIMQIAVDDRDPDEYMVYTGGNVLVQGTIGRQFSLTAGIESEGYARILWADTGEDLVMTGTRDAHSGSLGALVELRDETIETEIQSIDSLAMNFVDLVNEIHREGYGLNGKTEQNFFSEYPFVTNVAGNHDRDGDGAYDSSYIYRINGANSLDRRAQIGLEGTIRLSAASGLVDVPYYATDTVEDVLTRMNNSGAEVGAHLNRNGQLSLKGGPTNAWDTPDFVIRHVEDSGHFLTGYAGLLSAAGPEGAFDWAQADAVNVLRQEEWIVDQTQADTANVLRMRQKGAIFAAAPVAHPSGWIEVDRGVLGDPASIAAGLGENGRGANSGNGDAALAIAAVRNTSVMVGRMRTFDDYFADAVGRVGSLGRRSGEELETQNLIMKQHRDMRESISGVNMDEELAKMLKYQHGYAAAARFISTVNSMLDTLIRMGT